ncbi:MAG: 3'(2'),5'-bisphosphate nucleotidase CysQ family protein [Bacteriovoracaceae bacterium]
MKLTDRDLLELCELAKTAALKAGEHITRFQGQSVEVKEKSGGENIASCVVTEVDHKAQEIILDILRPTLDRFDLGLLAEESVDDSTRLEKDFFWCIDPLDGTLAFSRNEDGYSTSIALVSKGGTAIIGVVFNPRTQNLYHAIRSMGAYKNNKALKVREYSKKLTLLYDQSYLKYPEYSQQIEKLKVDLKALGFESLNDHPLGGAVMNGISTIEMAPALYYKFPKKNDGGGSIWDFAASSVIQSEANGFNSNYFKEPLKLNSAETTFMNQEGIIYSSGEDLLSLIPVVGEY